MSMLQVASLAKSFARLLWDANQNSHYVDINGNVHTDFSGAWQSMMVGSVDYRFVADWVTTAIEGGSEWIAAIEYVDADLYNKLKNDNLPVYSSPLYWKNGGRLRIIVDVNDDGEFEVYLLSADDIMSALFHDDMPMHTIDELLSESYDSMDVDRLIQYALFDEPVYC